MEKKFNTELIANDELFPDIPIDIRAARIGTCFNSVTRKLMSKKIAIDPNRLKSGAIEFVSNVGQLKLKMNSDTTKDSESTFFGLDAQAEGGAFSCSASIGFKTSLASAEASNSQSLNCYCSYVYEGQKMQLIDYGSNELYNYMSDEFQELYSAVITSKNAQEYFANYMKFINTFGYGCITQLYLTSGSAFRMSVKYADNSQANSSKYGASIAVSTPWGGGSVAAEFAKEVSSASSSASMELLSKQIPEDTPTRDWCNNLINSFAGEAFSKLSQSPDAIAPYSGDGPTAPELPAGKPSQKVEPDGNELDISDDMKKEIMKDDGFEGTWAEYEQAQKDAYDKLDTSWINSQSQKIKIQKKSTPSSSLNLQYKKDLNSIYAADENAGNSWSLGGYCPFAYTITSWSDLFPKLKGINLPTTFTSINISKIYMYYFTRIEFSGYLYFLADVGSSLCENDSILIDADIYRTACNDLLNKIQEMINSKQKIDDDDYSNVVSYFEEAIKSINNFYSKKVYDAFFDNYDFFADNSYGFISVSDTGYYVSVDFRTEKQLPKPFNLLSMLGDAVRVYPIIKNDGSIELMYYEYGWKSCVYHIDKTSKNTDEHGFRYYKLLPEEMSKKPINLYGVGFEDVPDDNENLSIRGLPMFNDLPFSEIKDFAKPRLN